MSASIRLQGGLQLAATVVGHGPGLLLAHGWPHSRAVWSSVVDELATAFTVVAPDLPGVGASDPTSTYDAAGVTAVFTDLMDALGLPTFSIMAIDAGVAPATLLALTSPARVHRLAVMEAVLPGLPGAGAFTDGGAPWWFGFHQVPGLTERVVAGHEDEYVGFFLDAGTVHGIEASTRDAMVDAYRGPRLGQSLGYYRALPRIAEQLRAAGAARRLTVPTLALGSAPVGPALGGQLDLVGDDVRSVQLDDCGHIIPLDAPRRLLDVAAPFLRP